MTHLSVEQLLALREPGLEPGVQAWRDHVHSCPSCQDELGRLDQRIARLKALPTLRPARDHFTAIRLKARAEGRRRQWLRVAVGSLALAASLTVAVVALRPAGRQLVAVSPELEEVISRSRDLERALASFERDRGVLDGRAVSITASLEERVAEVDRQLEVIDLLEASVRQQRALRLWRERVGLLDALMDVHVTGARYVGF
jgi:hypothetical protein